MDAFVAGLQAEGLPPVAFIKCDIEGAEAAMLKGARNLLQAEHPPIWLIEHNRQALADQGADSADLLAFFAGCEIYFVPLSWPPSRLVSPRAAHWNGRPDDLPDECNLVVFPKRGKYAERRTALQHASLLA
jgi:hypothetical protein